MRVLIVFLFIIRVTVCGAQRTYGFEEAFIMMKRGDSLKGFVEVAASYGPKIGYKKEISDVPTSISTKEIKFILTPGRSLENVQVGKKELLMTMVADGKIRLYLEVLDGSMVFVAKKGPLYTEVTRKRFREILSALMYDCLEVVQKLREKEFVYEEMHKAVIAYNSCQ